MRVSPLNSIFCDKKTCINYKEDHCSLANPEKVGSECLDYEDAMDFLEIKSRCDKGQPWLTSFLAKYFCVGKALCYPSPDLVSYFTEGCKFFFFGALGF